MLIWAVILYQKQSKLFWTTLSSKVKWLLILLATWIVFLFLDGFKVGFTVEWGNEIVLKLPLIIIPIYVLLLPKQSCGFANTWLIFTMLTTLVALVSTVHYWMNFEEINALLLQSKHVPIFGNMHHIYFGIILALCIWLCVHFYNKNIHKKVWLTCGVLLLVFMHILASRTGIIAFYAATLVYLLAISWQAKKYKWLVIGLLGMILLPVIGYQVSGSLRNKVANSMEDFNAVQSGKDINYKSLAMRIEAWKTSGRVIAKHPVLGVGASEVNNSLQKQYHVDQTVLYPENRVGPHNQFIEITLAHGIIGGLVLLTIVVLWIRETLHIPTILACTTVIIMSFMLESFLERQQGILVFCLFLFSFIQLPSKK